MNPITRKSVSKLLIRPIFKAVGQPHVEWQTFEKSENKKQMYYGSQASHACRITNFDTLFLVMEFISLVDEIQFLAAAIFV